MADLSTNQSGIAVQKQVLSAKQIQAFKFLSYSDEEIAEMISKFSETNPVISLGPEDDPDYYKHQRSGKKNNPNRPRNSISGISHTQVVEASADKRVSLAEELLRQLRVLNLSQSQIEIGTALIYNLDDDGFYLLNPNSLINKNDPLQTYDMVEEMIQLIRTFEPVGICCTNIYESLFIQACQRKDCPQMAHFLLNGHLSLFLENPRPERILKKILAYKAQQDSLFGGSDMKRNYPNLIINENEIIKALDFIKTLEPHPAANYAPNQTRYISPEVYVERLEKTDAYRFDDFSNGIVVGKKSVFRIRPSKNNYTIPTLNPQFTALLEDTSKTDPQTATYIKAIRKSVEEAKTFINSLYFRQSTILKVTSAIVKAQQEFFDYGQGNLKPLKQLTIADEVDLNPATISRMANNKILNCQWGNFPIKYFFSNPILTSTKLTISSEDGNSIIEHVAEEDTVSREKVLHELKIIMESHKNDSKNLSDIQISEILNGRGMKVARRTVAKYRKILNIKSSYDRK